MSFVRYNTEDSVISAESVVRPMWTGDLYTLSSFFTASGYTEYYLDVYNNTPTATGSEVQFDIQYGNRLGPPLRSADFDIFFDRGIDNFGGWLKVMKDNKLVKQGGAWYEYIDTDTGEVIKFQSKDFIQMMDTKLELKDQIYRKICESTILQYKKDGIDPDDITYDNGGEIPEPDIETE